MNAFNPGVSSSPGAVEAGGRWLIFSLAGREYALPIGEVERIVQSVEPAPLPGADPMIHGLMNLHGDLVPVINLRRRLGLAEKAVAFSDHFIIALTPRRRVALVVDQVADLVSSAAGAAGARHVVTLPGARPGEAALRYGDRLVTVYRMQNLFTDEADESLHRLLAAGGGA